MRKFIFATKGGTISDEAEKPSTKCETYHAYGTRIFSDWNLGFQGQRIRTFTHVEIRKARRPLSVKTLATDVGLSAGINGCAVILTGGHVYLNWPDLFEFRISSGGTRITGLPKAGVSLESFRTHLLGPVLSFALVRQGIEPLHATVVVKDDNAFALLGDSGYGKSSLAAAFLSAGYRLLTDDLLILQEKRDGIIAFPGVPRIKLFPEVADRFLGGTARAKRMHPEFEKLVIPLGAEKICQLPMPLRAIYALAGPAKSSNIERITIRRLAGKRAYVAVLRNTFNTKLTDSARLRRQFEMTARLVSKVPVKTLSYPRGLDLLPTVCEAVISDINRMKR